MAFHYFSPILTNCVVFLAKFQTLNNFHIFLLLISGHPIYGESEQKKILKDFFLFFPKSYGS